MTAPALAPEALEGVRTCPFCGAAAEIERYQACVSVGCMNGQCKVQPTADEDTLEESIAAWNRRSSIGTAEADRVCHEEQLIVWASEVEEALEFGGFLQEDMNYDDRTAMQRALMEAIKQIVGRAFDHPERATEPSVKGRGNWNEPVDLSDAERLAGWCVFWGERVNAPRHATYAAAMIRAQAKEIERLQVESAKPRPIGDNADREVAIREIFKDVLSHLTYATTCFEIASGMFATPAGRRDSEDAKTLQQLRAAENRGRGAYRDIFLAAEWRHDREVATSAVGNVLAKAGVTASPDVAEELVEAVLSSMPGSAGWEAGGENYWSGDALGGVK